jgi:hypothetical protein
LALRKPRKVSITLSATSSRGTRRCKSQVETPGMQALLRRVRDAADGGPRPALTSLEDLAQLVALSRPGAYGKDREQAYLTARFGSQRPALLHPSQAPKVLSGADQQLLARHIYSHWRAVERRHTACLRHYVANRHEEGLRRLVNEQAVNGVMACG